MSETRYLEESGAECGPLTGNVPEVYGIAYRLGLHTELTIFQIRLHE